MHMPRFRDRFEGGRVLCEALTEYAGAPGLLVVGLARGGVPVAYEVAKELRAPLDVFVVCKLPVPGQEEIAMGAVGSGGARAVNEPVVRELDIPLRVIDDVAERVMAEVVRRETLYRGGRAPPPVGGRTVLLVDDGLATGSSMRAAIAAMRVRAPGRVAVAVPIASADTCAELRADADDVVCPVAPDPFYAIGLWYEDFSTVTDDDVRAILARAEEEREV
jgi:predicted phosphoribosyltransferase